ncbi:hypothetical protein PR048_011068 [Dryococelus australis]|uniref:SWIM-type domain-containing protein n=1 Tax=Dryococelus australis TaxID=614101 RepID=A0ABQ9HKV2_9NEOP|nr:hypothetical protein PR048_011068 [Dryococelus australis]
MTSRASSEYHIETGVSASRCPATAPAVVPLVAGCGFPAGHGGHVVGIGRRIAAPRQKPMWSNPVDVVLAGTALCSMTFPSVQPPAIQGSNNLVLGLVFAPRQLPIVGSGHYYDGFVHPWLRRTHTAELLRLPCNCDTGGDHCLLLAAHSCRLLAILTPRIFLRVRDTCRLLVQGGAEPATLATSPLSVITPFVQWGRGRDEAARAGLPGEGEDVRWFTSTELDHMQQELAAVCATVLCASENTLTSVFVGPRWPSGSPAPLPPKRTGFNPRPGHRIFRMWESFRTMPLIGGFYRGSPASPALYFRHCSVPTSVTLIGSQDTAVKSRPNLLKFSVLVKSGSQFHPRSSVGWWVASFRSNHKGRVSTKRAHCLPPASLEAVLAVPNCIQSQLLLLIRKKRAAGIAKSEHVRVERVRSQVANWYSGVLSRRDGRVFGGNKIVNLAPAYWFRTPPALCRQLEVLGVLQAELRVPGPTQYPPVSLSLSQFSAPATLLLSLQGQLNTRPGGPASIPALITTGSSFSARDFTSNTSVISTEQRWNERAEETGDPRENPPTNGIVRHDSHMRESGDPAGDGARFALVGGEQANRSATAAPQTRCHQVVYCGACIRRQLFPCLVAARVSPGSLLWCVCLKADMYQVSPLVWVLANQLESKGTLLDTNDGSRPKVTREIVDNVRLRLLVSPKSHRSDFLRNPDCHKAFVIVLQKINLALCEPVLPYNEDELRIRRAAFNLDAHGAVTCFIANWLPPVAILR